MTGAIITQYYYKTGLGDYMRFFTHGSFFFIEPDVALTAWCNLTESRSSEGSVYAEDYFFFDSNIRHFKSETLSQEGIQCIRLEREWLREFPERNITEIRFPYPVSKEFFTVSGKRPKAGQHVICEGYGDHDFIKVDEDPDEIEFIQLNKREAKKQKLFRQGTIIMDIRADDSIYTDLIQIDKINVMYTSCYPMLTMIGGPMLDLQSNEVIGILSHETDDPYQSEGGLRGVPLYGMY